MGCTCSLVVGRVASLGPVADRWCFAWWLKIRRFSMCLKQVFVYITCLTRLRQPPILGTSMCYSTARSMHVGTWSCSRFYRSRGTHPCSHDEMGSHLGADCRQWELTWNNAGGVHEVQAEFRSWTVILYISYVCATKCT